MMEDSDIIEFCFTQLDAWEKRLRDSNLNELSNNELEQLAEIYEKDPQSFQAKQFANGMSPSTYNALIGRIYILKIRELTQSPHPEQVPGTFAAQIAWLSFQAGLLIGMSGPGSALERAEPIIEHGKALNQTGKTKNSLKDGENGPGRNPSEITRAMKILLSKIPPPMPYTYKRPQFIEDLITHKACIKHVIKPVKENDSYIHPIKPGERSATIESAHTKLMKLAKKKLVK